MRRLRRNDIVMERISDGHWSPFGRVWRRIDDTHVEVIDCMKHVTVYADDDLVLRNDYQGYHAFGKLVYDTLPNGERDWDSQRREQGRFIRMSTLRQLKRRASTYQPHFGGDSQWSREDRARALAEHKYYVPPEQRLAAKPKRKPRAAKAA